MRMVGRDAELALVRAHLDGARRGLGGCILIEGEGGAGKSRLLEELLNHAPGVEVFSARGHEIEHDRPFGVIADALGVRAASADPARAAVAALVRGSPEVGPGLRFRAAEDMVEIVERAGLSGPVLLALDDLQWADPASILTLHMLLRRTTYLPVLVACACRPSPRTPEMDGLVAAVQATGGYVRLQALDAAATAEIAREIIGAEPGPRVREFIAGAAGNPFFVSELVSALLEEGSIGPDGDVAERVPPPALRSVVLGRLRELGPDTLHLLKTASVLGTSFAPADLAVSVGVMPTETMGSLEECLRAGVLVEDGERLRFRHDLLREALYQDLPLAVRRALHAQCGQALASVGAPAERVAPQFAAGAQAGDSEAVRWLRLAAAECSGAAPASAVEWLRQALNLLPVGDEGRDEIAAELAGLLVTCGRLDEAEEVALEPLKRRQPPERRVELKRTLSAIMGLRGLGDGIEALERESREPDVPEVERLRLRAEVVQAQAQTDPDAHEDLAREVLDRAVDLDDDFAAAFALCALFAVAWWRSEYTHAVDLAQRALARAVRVPAMRDDGVDILLAMALRGADRNEEALRVLRDGLRAAEARGSLPLVPRYFAMLGAIDYEAGRWDDAVAHLEADQQIITDAGAPGVHRGGLDLLATIAARRNELDRATGFVRRARGGRPTDPTWAWRVVQVGGDNQRALEMLRGRWSHHNKVGATKPIFVESVDLVRLELDAGERHRAEEVAGVAEEVSRRAGAAWVRSLALRCRALVAQDADAALQALALVEGSEHTRLASAEAAEDAARILAGAERTDEAVRLFREALGFYDLIEAAWDSARVRAALRDLGVRRGARGPRPRTKTGWDSLTATETRVVELAVQGLTNAEVGARMFLSGRTVERHLTHVYAKLEVASRLELVARAAERR